MNKYLVGVCGFNAIDPNTVTKVIGVDDDHYVRVVSNGVEYRLMQPTVQYPTKKSRVIGVYVEKVVETVVEIDEKNDEYTDIVETVDTNVKADTVINDLKEIGVKLGEDTTLFNQEQSEKRGRGRPKTK